MPRNFENRGAAKHAQAALCCALWRRGRALRWRGHAACLRWRSRATCLRWRGGAACMRWRGHATCLRWRGMDLHMLKTCATLLMADPVAAPRKFTARGAPPWPALLRARRNLAMRKCLITAEGADRTAHHEARVTLSAPSETLGELLLHSFDCPAVPLKRSSDYIPENEWLEAPPQLRHLAQVHGHIRPEHRRGHAISRSGCHCDLQRRALRFEGLAADDARCGVAASGVRPLARHHVFKNTRLKFLERAHKATRRRPKPDQATKIQRRVALGLGAGPQVHPTKCPEQVKEHGGGHIATTRFQDKGQCGFQFAHRGKCSLRIRCQRAQKPAA